MDKDMSNLFPDDHQHWPSSSSSSFRSLSTAGSPEYSSLLMSNVLTTSTPQIEHAIRPTSTIIAQDQQTMQAYCNSFGIGFPDSDDAVITRAMLAVISSPPSLPSSSYQSQQTPTGRRQSAFKRYTCDARAPHNGQKKVNMPRQNMLKHAISMLRNMYYRRIEEQTQANRPTTNSQLHHKMSERKRREKLNQTLQQLRSLLPPGSKKDKASVLSNTRDYLSSLKAEVLELEQKNQQLEARISERETMVESTSTSNERIHIDITDCSQTMVSDGRQINIQVTVRGNGSILDLVTRVFEFLKLVQNARLVYMEADSSSQETSSLNRLSFRMKIEGGQWDESAFREAIERVVADVVL